MVDEAECVLVEPEEKLVEGGYQVEDQLEGHPGREGCHESRSNHGATRSQGLGLLVLWDLQAGYWWHSADAEQADGK